MNFVYPVDVCADGNKSLPCLVGIVEPLSCSSSRKEYVVRVYKSCCTTTRDPCLSFFSQKLAELAHVGNFVAQNAHVNWQRNGKSVLTFSLRDKNAISIVISHRTTVGNGYGGEEDSAKFDCNFSC
jgi:hypothetical protein